MTGHFWTIAPNLWRAPDEPLSRDWSTVVQDPDMGPVTLRGRWSAPPDADTALLIIHGLGGTWDRHYCRRAAAAARRRGWGSLRLALRGADRRGEDIHHAGLSVDLATAVSREPLAGLRRVFLWGYSLGGHLALRAAASDLPDHVCGVVSLCAPVDLEAGATHLDRRSSTLYRRHVLAGLREIYQPFAQRHPDWPPVETLQEVDSIRAFDTRTVVRRFGFQSAEHYYQLESACRTLPHLRAPALGIWSTQDPMVPWASVTPHLTHASQYLTIRAKKTGGHVYFPTWTGVENEALDWLDQVAD